jgi:hypothetical protein
MKLTEVIKITTGEILIFKNLTPREAVCNAFIREALYGCDDIEMEQAKSAINKIRIEGDLILLGDYVSVNDESN